MKRILFNLLNSGKRLFFFFTLLLLSNVVFSQTRFYLNLNTAAAVSPAYHTTWNVTSGAARYEMNTTKDGSTITSKTTGNSGAIAVRRCLLDQWVSEPLDAQTITGTFTGQIRFQQSTTTAVTGQGIVYLRVINPNGTIATVVGSATTTNLTTTLTNRTLISLNVGTLNITAGQRLAIDVGWNYSVGVATTPNCTISRGSSSATNLPVNNSTTTASSPWVEFSDNLVFLPPANDDCAGAVTLTPGASCVNTNGTLKYATPDVATPIGCFAAGTYYDVWYSFVATTYTHTVLLSGLGTNFTAPRIQIYSGTCGALVSEGCASGTSLTQANLIPGATYFVRIANYNADPSGLGNVANFNICVTNNPPPANDACAGSVLLTSNLACSNTTGNLQFAASVGTAGACGGATVTTTYDVWYRFVANSTTHAITLSSLGSNLSAATTYIETFSGACGSLTPIDCQNAGSPEVLSGLTIGDTYYVRIYVTSAPNNATTANWNFNICIQQPPANDECTGAVNLTPGAACVNTSGTLHVATPNVLTGVPLGCFAAGTYYDVWYSFTATTFTHTVTLSSLGANITAPRIQIYSGNCGALVSEGCVSGTTLTQANLTPGTTYYIRVANYNADPSGTGGFNICVTNNPPPANDACAGSVLLTSNITCSNTTGNLQYAASNGPAGACGSATATTTYDVWYRFVANSTTHYVTLSGLGSNLTAATTYIETFSGACGSLTPVDCQNAGSPEVLSGLTIGNTYYVRIYVTSAPNNATIANWNFSICIQQPPANDECTGAVNLTPGASCVNTAGTLNLSTANVTTPLGCFAAGNYYDVWYRFTATTTIETITLSSLGANFTAPRIQLYSGTCGSLNSIACVSGTSLLQYGLTVGAVYYVRIANFNVNPLTAAGFNICITYITPPANDECTGALTLTGNTTCSTTSGTLLNSSPNSSGLPVCGNSGSAEVWYKFIANSNRPVITLSGLGSNLNTAGSYIQLFSGLCGSLTSLACVSGTSLNTAITPGGVGLTINSTYYIRIITNTNTSVPTSGNWGFSICVTDPAAAAVDFAKTYVNITDGTAGGTIDPGDVLEIRSILVVQRPGSSTTNVAIDSVAFYDTLSANKGFRLLKDSMALKTNEGKLFRPTNNTYFTDNSADADAAWITTAGAGTDTALQINMGTGASRTARGVYRHNSRPSNFGSTCIIMATYRVRVTAVYGTKIEYGGGAFRYRDSTTGVFYTVNFPKDSLIVYSSPGACPDAASATNVVGDEFGGTFGAPSGSPVYPQNRGTSANTNYAYATFGGGNGPGDYYYGVTNNTSGNGTTVQTVPKPTATTRVFSVWDISGDHTGATNTGSTSKGNLPCNLNAPISATNPCGYMLVVNSAYRADVAFEYNFSGACTETYYEISAWVKNICSKCGCDSLGTGSTNTGYQPTAPGDSSGVRPNLAFQINGIDYFTTGDIAHAGVTGTQTGSDTLNRWVKRSFVYKTQPGETSFNMTFRNNAPGGGGNDWAIDDISIRTCYPNMTYSPSVNPNACANNSLTITDTVRSYYNTYTYYKWQRSTDGGVIWNDIAGASGTATPVVVNGMYEFVTTYIVPAAFTTPANSGDKYRVVVATNTTNLASNSCSFSDIIPITITVTQPSIAPTSISGTNICNPGSVTLTAVGGTLGTSANYQWGTGSVVGTNSIVGATSASLTVSPTATTTYWVRIENATSPCPPTTSGLTKTVTVSQPSSAPTSISGANICSGSSTTLTASGGTLGTSANYQWGTGSVVGTNPIVGATNSTLTVSPTVTTTYWVRIENTSSPCTATTGGLTKTITVTQSSVAPTSITGPDICSSGSTTLTANGGILGTSANYQWGTGSVVGTNPIVGATASTLIVSPTSTTTYWVYITNTAGPCTPTTGGVTKVVTVNQLSVAPSSISGPDICNGSSTTLTVSGGVLGTGANYQWGTGSTPGTSPIVGATSSTLTVSPTVTTTYWVRIENNAAPCSANTGGITKLITVNQPSVAATAAGKNKNNICPGISAKIYRTGGTTGTGASWRWYTGSPGGTLIGSGDTLNVTPAVTTTYYLRAEGMCNTTAAQAVTIFISCDIDKDKDGIPDYIESNIAAAVANGYNTGYAGYVDYNNDFINDNFQADGDSDNDGIPNYLDATYPGRVDSNSDGIDDRFDTDLDGVINMLDLDSDNDGIPDTVEAYGVDANGDGKIDNFTDTDGDGLSQNVDPNATGANNSGTGLGVPNLDGDAVPNFLDLDSDNDGIPDVVEVGGTDANNNGMIDGFVDVNGDGLHDSYINGTALLLTGTDGNADGKADSWPNKNMDRDLRPNAYDMDSDGDGIADVIEAGLPDANMNGIVDGTIGSDGWSTSVSALVSLNLRSTDADGKPDYLDIDADNDGIPDNIEGQSTASYKLPTLTDADGDGLMLPYDNAPVAFGGSGILVYDHDADNTPDYRDLDTDADGLPDIVEGNDFNLNAVPDDNVTLTGLDTDGDGLDNRFDSLNSVTNIKGTSFMMGTNGSFTGDATPGSRSPVQRSFTYQTDRDWRFAGYVLPVQFVKLSGQLQSNNKVPLSWAVIAGTPVDHFEVERSTDNRNFVKAGTVTQAVNLNVEQTFGFTDDVSTVTNDVLYYRIKVIGKAGELQYSNILIIRKQQTKPSISIMPNPANDYVYISLYAEKAAGVTIRMIDESGKTVLLKNEKLSRGSNTLQLAGLTKYSNGAYTLQVFINDEVISQKLILHH